jgi:uncharacterized protein
MEWPFVGGGISPSGDIRSPHAFQADFGLDRPRVWTFSARLQPPPGTPMSFSIYDASIPPMIRSLENLSKIMSKAVAQAKDEKIELSSLLEARLAPDMHPFTRQVQIASDAVKGAIARLAGIEPPSFPDTETTFPELQARIAKTIDFLKSVTRAQLEGAEDRTVTMKFPQGDMKFSGRDLLTNFALPNFYFHVTTAYGLLRHKGIKIGKMDYLGG